MMTIQLAYSLNSHEPVLLCLLPVMNQIILVLLLPSKSVPLLPNPPPFPLSCPHYPPCYHYHYHYHYRRYCYYHYYCSCNAIVIVIALICFVLQIINEQNTKGFLLFLLKPFSPHSPPRYRHFHFYQYQYQLISIDHQRMYSM